jgi:hypothetical protein
MGRMTAPNDSPPVRKSWLRFSLASLFLLTALICVTTAYLLQRRESVRKDAEIRQYRIDLGLLDDRTTALVIDDATKVHVAALPAPRALQWRWRVYVPPGNQWTVRLEQGRDNAVDFGGSATSTSLDERGEMIIEARLERALNGKARMVVNWGTEGLTSSVAEKGAEVILHGERVKSVVAGQPKQQSYEAQGEIDLLRFHYSVPGDTTPVTRPSEPYSEFGFSIHFLETTSASTPPQQAGQGRE